MQKWDVWTLSQEDARELTNPSQPLDQSKDRRCYVVMTPNAMLKGAQQIVCLPIQTSSNGTSFCVEIPNGSSGLHNKLSHCWTNTPYTLPKSSFVKKIGYVGKTQQDEISFALIEFFELTP